MYVKYADSVKIPGGVAAPSVTRRNWRFGSLTHCLAAGCPGGKPKVVGTHCHCAEGFCLSGTTLIENDGIHRLRFRITILARVGQPAKTRSGKRISSSRPRSTSADATPDTRMAANMAATIT